MAVKTIRRSQARAPLLLRFDRERRLLARLHHTNIVPIYATGHEGDLLFFAMPYIDGASLGQVIRTARSHGRMAVSSLSTSFEDLLREAHFAELGIRSGEHGRGGTAVARRAIPADDHDHEAAAGSPWSCIRTAVHASPPWPRACTTPTRPGSSTAT